MASVPRVTQSHLARWRSVFGVELIYREASLG